MGWIFFKESEVLADERFANAQDLAAKIKKARRRLEKAEADVVRTAHERDQLKWILLPMATTWPLGFVWHGWIALYIFLAWFSVYGVGRYLSWGHHRNAVDRLAETRAEVTALTLLNAHESDAETEAA